MFHCKQKISKGLIFGVYRSRPVGWTARFWDELSENGQSSSGRRGMGAGHALNGHSLPRATSELLDCLPLLVSPNAVRARIRASRNHLWLSKRLRQPSTCTNGVFGKGQ